MNGKLNWKGLKITTIDNYYAHEYGAVVFDIPFKLEIISTKYTERFLKTIMTDAIVDKITKINWPLLNPTGECNIINNLFCCIFLPVNGDSYKFYKNKASLKIY